MGVQLTKEEMTLVKDGKLDPNNIIEHRKLHPIRSINLNEVDVVKQQIKEANLGYRAAIDRNKDLYNELEENRKRKEECRNKLAELRLKKKQLLGLE